MEPNLVLSLIDQFDHAVRRQRAPTKEEISMSICVVQHAQNFF